MLVPLLYFATIGYLWVVTDYKEADQRQQTAVACTASQNAIALLIAATWDMRAAEMDPVVPTMNELSECEFRFFETDWRIPGAGQPHDLHGQDGLDKLHHHLPGPRHGQRGLHEPNENLQGATY